MVDIDDARIQLQSTQWLINVAQDVHGREAAPDGIAELFNRSL